jgi:hypothetical protein
LGTAHIVFKWVLMKAEAANIRDCLQQTSLPAQPEQRGLLIEATWYALEIGTLLGLQSTLEMSTTQAIIDNHILDAN